MENRRPKIIKNSRRILVLGPPDCGIPEILKELTGTVPNPIDGSIVGLSHIWDNKNKYYQVEVPIWIDEIQNPKAWSNDFKQPEAEAVVETIAAYIYVFRKPKSEDEFNHILKALEAIYSVVEEWQGPSFDGTKLAVAMPIGKAPKLDRSAKEWEEFCEESGFEYIDWEAKSTSDHELVGFARLKEALEVTDWNSSTDNVIGDGENEEDEGVGVDGELAEMQLELNQLNLELERNAAQGSNEKEDEEDEIEGLDQILAEAQAIKDTGSSMSEIERKKFSERAVNDLINKYNL